MSDFTAFFVNIKQNQSLKIFALHQEVKIDLVKYEFNNYSFT